MTSLGVLVITDNKAHFTEEAGLNEFYIVGREYCGA